MARFADKLALVTGASRGIGRAVAKVLAREGAHVILAARREGSLEDVDDEIRSLGGSATLVKLDVTAGDKVDALIYRWPERTEMRQQAFPGEDPMTLPTPEDIAEQFLDVVDPACVDNGRVFSLDKRTK